MLRKLKAFTLIELLIVIAIIAILTVAFLPTLRGGQAAARDAARKAAVNDIVVAIERIINGDFAAAPNNIPGAIPVADVGGCLDFATSGTVGNNIRTALARTPSYDSDGITATTLICTSGYFYRSYSGASPTNYVVATQLEQVDQGNLWSVTLPTNVATLNAALGATWSAVLSATTPAATNQRAIWVITK